MPLILSIAERPQEQTLDDWSFLGGRPRLPKTVQIPVCPETGDQQTFFLQVTYPEGHPWNEWTTALFQSTTAVSAETLIPPLLTGGLKNADVPRAFLEGYPEFFRVVTQRVEDCVLREDYEPRLQFARLSPVEKSEPVKGDLILGGVPIWIEEDEAPASFEGSSSFDFLFQVPPLLEFKKLPDAPAQMILGLSGDPEPSDEDFYELFIGDSIYAFGVMDDGEPRVYLVPQSD